MVDKAIERCLALSLAARTQQGDALAATLADGDKGAERRAAPPEKHLVQQGLYSRLWTQEARPQHIAAL